MSNADVPLVVNNTFCALNLSSNHLLHFLVKAPSPQILCEAIACSIYLISSPKYGGILNGII